MKNIKKPEKPAIESSKPQRYTSKLYKISSEDLIEYKSADVTISLITEKYNEIQRNKFIYKKNNKENYFMLGKHLTYLLLNFGYFDRLEKVMKREKIYSFINPEKYTNIYNLFKNSAQFDFTTKSVEKDRTEEDIIANVMILANKLAHIFDINEEIISSELEKINEEKISSKLETNDVVSAKKLFYEIKVDCINELIDLKIKGRPILIVLAQDDECDKTKNVYNIVLPNYLSPFSVHTSVKCNDFDKIKREFMSYFDFETSPYIPVKIDQTDCERLKQLSQQGDLDKKKQKYISRIKDFIRLQDHFETYKEKNKIGKKVSDYIDKLRNLRKRIFLLNGKIDKENEKKKPDSNKLRDYKTECENLKNDLKNREAPINMILGTEFGTDISKEKLINGIIQYRRQLKLKKDKFAEVMKALMELEDIMSSPRTDSLQPPTCDELNSSEQEKNNIDEESVYELWEIEETLEKQLKGTEEIEEWLDEFYK